MERGRIIVNNTDYTGSFVTPNPSEPPTKDLNTLEIEGEVFNIAGSGGGGVGDITNYYGVFVDTQNIILPETKYVDGESYTATQDCYGLIYYQLGSGKTQITLDGVDLVNVSQAPTAGSYIAVSLLKGQTLNFISTFSGSFYLTVYGVKSGDRIPALIQDAQIYSLEEKQVGAWVDGKPLYQKTWIQLNAVIPYDTWTNLLAYANVEKMVSWEALDENGKNLNGIGIIFQYYNGYVQGAYTQSHDIRKIDTFTMWYTKTTDEEGSGGYQAYGMSPVIYSTKEREIGVWIDNKPLYQKTFEKSISVTSTSRTWYTVITSSELRAIDADKIFIETSDSYIEDSDGLYEVNYSSIVGNLGGLMGGVYDKTTDVVQLCIAGVSAGTKTAKITIKYTKTTDSPKRTGYELLDIQENQIIVDATRYSTEEKIIGTWIDNKPLYQKTLVISSIPSNSYDYYNFASNVDKVINYQGMVIDTSSDTSMNICYVRPDNTNVQFYTQILADKRFFFRTYTSWTASAYITFYYTKTTDAVGSGGYQAYGFSPIIYSEEEREVGVWINNKPLYQKTLVFENYTNGTYQDVSSLNIEEVVNNFGEHRLADYSYGLSFPYYENNNWYSLMTFDKNNGRYYVYCSSQMADTYKKLFITIQYTKTTDVAGSGEYNTLGVPNVHYDSNEKIIGTWFGETLYERTLNIGSISSANDGYVIGDKATLKIKDCVELYGKCTYEANGEKQTIPLPNYNNSAYYIRVYYESDLGIMLDMPSLNGKAGIWFEYSNDAFQYYNNDIYITIRYTKTSN